MERMNTFESWKMSRGTSKPLILKGDVWRISANAQKNYNLSSLVTITQSQRSGLAEVQDISGKKIDLSIRSLVEKIS